MTRDHDGLLTFLLMTRIVIWIGIVGLSACLILDIPDPVWRVHDPQMYDTFVGIQWVMLMLYSIWMLGTSHRVHQWVQAGIWPTWLYYLDGCTMGTLIGTALSLYLR